MIKKGLYTWVEMADAALSFIAYPLAVVPHIGSETQCAFVGDRR
jgi:hypothetical protein